MTVRMDMGAARREREREQQQQTGRTQAKPAAILKCDNLGVHHVSWLWFPRIPAGQISLLGAPGGGGKGLNAAEYTACVTTGRAWPDGTAGPEPGNVLWCETEDPICEVVVPRLIAAGADRSKVHVASRQAFHDLGDGLRGFITSNSIRLILMSPIVSFLQGLIDINGELGVREVLEKLQNAIDGTGCAVLGLAHTNKRADLRAIERLLGSVAFGNFVRSVLLVGRDKDDDQWFRLVHAKHNLSIKGDDLLYRPKHVGDDPRDQFVKLEWQTTTSNIEADALFDRAQPNGHDRRQSARAWLTNYLEKHGESLRVDIVEAGGLAGYKEDALRTAQQRSSNIKSRQDGFQGPYYWRLDARA